MLEAFWEFFQVEIRGLPWNFFLMVLSFAYLFVMFRPMETTFPAKPFQKVKRPEWFLDLCYFTGNYLFWTNFTLFLLFYARDHYIQNSLPLWWFKAIASQPFWLQMLEVVLLSDFLI